MHRYGIKILTTSRGRYYWDPILQICTFVKKGKQVESWSGHVSYPVMGRYVDRENEHFYRGKLKALSVALTHEGLTLHG